MKSKQLTNIRAAGKDVRPPTMRLLVLADVLLADFTAGHYQAHASPRADSRGLHRVRCPTNMLRAAFERSYCCEITLYSSLTLLPLQVHRRRRAGGSDTEDCAAAQEEVRSH